MSQLYFDEFGNEPDNNDAGKNNKIIEKMTAHQCADCLTLHDASFGDEKANIPTGTLFESLENTYQCSVCESPKESFVIVEF